MKLQLKHIAPYLPYKLMAKFPESNRKGCKSLVVGPIGALYSDCSIVCHETVNASPDRFRPLLVPLAFFNNINSPAFQEINCDVGDQIEIHELALKMIHYTDLSVGAYEVCLMNHIDIFDLIPTGLAIAKTIFNETK